jgi:hypothetical protein
MPLTSLKKATTEELEKELQDLAQRGQDVYAELTKRYKRDGKKQNA